MERVAFHAERAEGGAGPGDEGGREALEITKRVVEPFFENGIKALGRHGIPWRQCVRLQPTLLQKWKEVTI